MIHIMACGLTMEGGPCLSILDTNQVTVLIISMVSTVVIPMQEERIQHTEAIAGLRSDGRVEWSD
jgi:hypothetical protein